jgi:hypothetical protein
MSLVGSLEDLGLGDILQIVHLSGKSGVLALRGDVGEGQIVFDKGLVRSATARGLPQDLRELLARQRALPADALADGAREARRTGLNLSTVLLERGLLTEEALDDLRARAITDAVVEMFRWQAGEFSFEVSEYAAAGDDLAVARGMNPQFLALEGTRSHDEASEGGPADDGEDTDVVRAAPLPAGEDPFADPPAIAQPLPEAEHADDEPLVTLAEEAPPDATPGRVAVGALGQPPPVVVIEPSLPALEWIKSALTGHSRVHGFQHTELGIQRVRQYLLRGELPLVLLAADTPSDPVSGARDVYDVAARLRRQAPRLPIVVISPTGARLPQRRRSGALPSAFAERPKDGALADARRSAERLEIAAALRAVVERLPGDAAPPQAQARAPTKPAADVGRLREVRRRMREHARQGEVLSNVLGFAAQIFSRVALFMVRDDSIVGIAQVGLAKAGGPDDGGMRDLTLPARESSWVRRVLETVHPVRGRPVDDGDHRLVVMLGNEVPSEAFLAPIESANRVAALLYADNLPGRAALPDTGALEVVLHEAGLALERALLERALAESPGGGDQRA